MDYKEFGKRIQHLSEHFKKLTGEELEISFNEETGYLSSRVYNGYDYPKDRRSLIWFINDEIYEYYMKDKLIFIEPLIRDGEVISCWAYLKSENNGILHWDLLEWYDFPINILQFYTNYLKGIKNYTIRVWEEEAGPYRLKIHNDKTYLLVFDEVCEDEYNYKLSGTPKEQAKEILSHFKKYLNEWEKGCNKIGEITKLCEELEILLNENFN